MARIEQERIAVGHWWAGCCLHDLQRVETEEDAAMARETWMMYCGAWESCAEAVSELIQECDEDERLFLLRWYRGGGSNPEIASELARYINEEGA